MQLNITNQTIVAANQPTNVSLSNMLHIRKCIYETLHHSTRKNYIIVLNDIRFNIAI